ARGTRDIPIRCDTLAIDTDRLLCKATWRAQLPLTSPDEAGQVRVELSPPARPAAGPYKTGQHPVYPSPAERAPSGVFQPPVAPVVNAPAVRTRMSPMVDQTLELTEAVAAMNLPFKPSAPPPPANEAPKISKSVLLQRPVETTADLSNDDAAAAQA